MKEFETETTQQDTYQTGQIRPPRRHQGLVAVLLVAVIFLGGVVSALGIINVRLFRLLEEKTQPTEKISVQFFRASGEDAGGSVGTHMELLGIVGQEVDELWHGYYGWPMGVYISQMIPDSIACRSGLKQGDILVAVNGIQITCEETLIQQLHRSNRGTDAYVRVFRDGKQFNLALIDWE